MKYILTPLAIMILAQCANAQNVTVIGPITPGDVPQFNSPTVVKDSGIAASSILTGVANPTGSVGLTTVNGAATTAMRSDAAPPLSASVQASLTATNGNILIGTGAFGFNSTATIPAANFGSNVITNAMIAQMPGKTIKGNNTASTANAADLTGQQAEGVLQFTQGIGTGVQYLLDAKIQGREIDPDDYGTVDRTGVTDMTTLLNTTIAAAQSCNATAAGNTVIRLRAGTYRVNGTIRPKSCTTIRGDGRGKTILLTNNATPFSNSAGTQLVHFVMTGITFKEAGSFPSATAMLFPNIQGSVLSNLGFTGYSTGTLMSIATAAVTTFDDTNTVWNNSNSIFNVFYDWWTDGCSTCISEAGHYGTVTQSQPPNSANVPDQVVTQNRYDNIVLFACVGKCVDIVKATDTEFLTNLFIRMTSNSAVCAQLGDDAAFPGNNGVSSIHFQITCTFQAPATTLLAFRAQNWTYGHIIDFDTDAVPSAVTIAQAQASVTQFKYDLCGNNYRTALIDNNGFNTNRLCESNDIGSGTTGQATYYRIGNGTSAEPIWGFANDFTNGIYLAAAGEAAFSKNLRIDGHILSGAASTPLLSACGTTPVFTGTPSDTAADITVGTGAPTACTVTFGTPFVNAPYCSLTPIGVPNAGLAITSRSNTAITFALTGVSNQQVNYICIGQPSG